MPSIYFFPLPPLPPFPPFLSCRLVTPRPPVRFLIAFRSLTSPFVSCRAFGASSETRVRLFEGVAPIAVRIERDFDRSEVAETSFASNCGQESTG